MRRVSAASLLIALTFLAACSTTAQLDKSVLAQGSALRTLQEEMVLSNLELLRQRPHALPWHLKITSGSVTIDDTINPSFSLTWPPTSRVGELNPSRSIQVQWNVSPITDERQIRDLKDVYTANVQDSVVASKPTPTCSDAAGNYRFFRDNFEEGTLPPAGRPHGYFNGKFIWVNADPAAEDCFDQIVIATFHAAPVTAEDRGLSVPLGAQQPLGKH